MSDRTPSQRVADMALAQVESGTAVLVDDQSRFAVATRAGSVHVGQMYAFLNDHIALELPSSDRASLYAAMRDAYLTQRLPREQVAS